MSLVRQHRGRNKLPRLREAPERGHRLRRVLQPGPIPQALPPAAQMTAAAAVKMRMNIKGH